LPYENQKFMENLFEINLNEKNIFQNKAEKIADYISGIEVRATPEEVQSVQVFAKQLVEDYGYPKINIQTHPQFRVKVRPSDAKKKYPVDIAVFKTEQKSDENLFLIVECKKKNRKDGKTQLENYLTLSSAKLGVWFNGEERLFLHKIVKPNGEVHFQEIPNLPTFNQRIEDIGQFKRSELKPTHNLKAIFKSIRNFLAANNVGATRDEKLAEQLIHLIFCKLYDEKFTKPDEIIRFRAEINENPQDIENRIFNLFNEVKNSQAEIFGKEDKIILDTKSIIYVVGELQNYSLTECERDVVSDAFETFIGHALKGGQGQFFTPRNVIKMMVEMLNPTGNDKIIDPACGSGGFLIESLLYVWKNSVQEFQEFHWKESLIEKTKSEIATNHFRGIDKDYFLSKIAKAYMNLIGDGTTGIFCEDSLENPQNWKIETQQKIKLENFDIVLTNPPFGEKIKVKGSEKLQQYQLAYEWKVQHLGFEKSKLRNEHPPQILFIERCLQLLRNGGRMAIVLPEGVFGNTSDRYIWNFINEFCTIEAIVSLPSETFQPNTSFKTSVLFVKKEKPKSDYSIFLALAQSCGHNKNGKNLYKLNLDGSIIVDKNNLPIIDDELPEISKKFRLYLGKKLTEPEFSHTGFVILYSQIKNLLFLPQYYNADLRFAILNYEKNEKFSVKTVANLLEENVLEVKRGNEIGSENYGRGNIPFIRTSDLVNWEIIPDYEKSVSDEVFEIYRKNQDIRVDDVLFVKDGGNLIGTTAIVTENDEKIIIQSHILKLRVLKKEIFTNYYLLYLLNLPIVKQQVRSFTFIQGTIPTLADRFRELKLPIHNDKNEIQKISAQIKNIIDRKVQIKNEIKNLFR